ncbi:protein kinase [Acidiphilium sp. AL]|uniref:Serine/threonine-protein kinase n=1 Tax=Acidiphilium iwatense TaxID=768198 RepID=A0ABS9E235_9PROT|nr:MULTISPECIES: serine/threonine-protein kinase [Acidiphilium]MCF3948470.1 serine/threonine-protein kinase [Acidiphilium iwatense]MCU4158537.1 protein kinase [Acidiphilium sp. AL]
MAATDFTTLGKYDIVRAIGRGAMGTVYEGFDPIIARRVAIKTVSLDRADDPEAAEDLLRFKREAQAAGRLTHPNIVGVYDYGETETLAYIVMEFVEGDTLKSLLDRGERFAVADALRMMEALLAGLAYSHDHGVIHRDIKPANVMITRDGRVKLADFGVARIESSSLTQAGTMIGTPSYMSPEQFMGQTIDARTDIYSAGVLLYQLLTGEKPFEGSVTGIMHKVLNTEPPAASALSVSVTPALDAVVRRAMTKRPEDRFASARDFAAALHTSDAPADGDATMIAPTARPAPRPAAASAPAIQPATALERPKSRTPIIAAAAAIVLLLAAGGGFLLLGGKPKPQKQAAPPQAAPATQPQPKAAAAPPTPAPKPADLAAIRSSIAAAIAPVPCTLLHGTTTATRADLHGLVGVSAVPALRAALSHPPIQVGLLYRGFDGPYCGLIGAIRPFAPVFANPDQRLDLHLVGNVTKLAKGQHIVVELGLPSWPAYVEVDYVSSSGSIYRLYPSAQMPASLHQAGGTLELGRKPGPQWAVGAPYGEDMILAIASSAPIDILPKSPSSDITTFLPALKTALSGLKSQGADISTAAILLDTVRK